MRAILSHADYTGVPRDSRLEHVLYAVRRADRVRHGRGAGAARRRSIVDLKATSVLKRMKDKAFARAVNRDDLRRGAEEINLPLVEHAANVIAFMRERADLLGLRGLL